MTELSHRSSTVRPCTFEPYRTGWRLNSLLLQTNGDTDSYDICRSPVVNYPIRTYQKDHLNTSTVTTICLSTSDDSYGSSQSFTDSEVWNWDTATPVLLRVFVLVVCMNLFFYKTLPRIKVARFPKSPLKQIPQHFWVLEPRGKTIIM